MDSPLRPGALVIVYLHSPREKIWGVLCELGQAGVTLRGIDVGSFDDWLRGLSTGEEGVIQPSIAFYPLGRVEKVLLDEPEDPLGLSAQCRSRTGRAPHAALAAGFTPS